MHERNINKYSVAWFKLSEFISRGERERALGIFRLLAHSMNDKGLVAQLEGDIYLSFEDKKKAVDCYVKAGEIYQKKAEYFQAAAIFEHLLYLQPDLIEIIERVLRLYLTIDNTEKINKIFKLLMQNLTTKSMDLVDYIYSRDFVDKHKLYLYELSLQYFFDKQQDSIDLKSLVLKIISKLKYNNKNLESFMEKLEKLDSELYNYAVSSL